MAEANKDDKKLEAEAKAAAEAAAAEAAQKPKQRVEVICEGMLGHLLLKAGDVTSDEEYTALLKNKKQQLVREVK